jgi:hypothetical protein
MMRVPSAGSLSVFILAAVVAGVPAAKAQGGYGTGKAASRQVTLQYVGGELCVTVLPDPATVWRGTKRTPIRRVDWLVVDAEERYWEIRYAPDKDGAEGNYFNASGTIDIPCGDNLFRTRNPQDPGRDGARWPYSITVYSCVDGSKGERLCEKDPEIDWGR